MSTASHQFRDSRLYPQLETHLFLTCSPRPSLVSQFHTVFSIRWWSCSLLPFPACLERKVFLGSSEGFWNPSFHINGNYRSALSQGNVEALSQLGALCCTQPLPTLGSRWAGPCGVHFFLFLFLPSCPLLFLDGSVTVHFFKELLGQEDKLQECP